MAKILKAIKSIFQTQYDRCPEEEQFEKVNPDLPSLTQPDQALSIPEIMKRYARGQSLGGGLDGYFELDENDEGVIMPDLEKMDLVEIEELKRQTKEKVEKLRAEIQQSQTEEAKKFRLEEERKNRIGSLLLHLSDDPAQYAMMMEGIEKAIKSKATHPAPSAGKEPDSNK